MGTPINQLVEEGDSIHLCIYVYINIYIYHTHTHWHIYTHSLPIWTLETSVDGCFGPPAGNVTIFISSDPPSGLCPVGNLICIVVYLVYFPIYPSFSRNHRKMYPIWFLWPRQSAGRLAPTRIRLLVASRRTWGTAIGSAVVPKIQGLQQWKQHRVCQKWGRVTAISFVFSTCKFLKAGCLGTTVLDKPRLGQFLQAWVGEMVNIPSILASILASCVRYVKWSTLGQVCLQLSLRWQNLGWTLSEVFQVAYVMITLQSWRFPSMPSQTYCYIEANIIYIYV